MSLKLQIFGPENLVFQNVLPHSGLFILLLLCVFMFLHCIRRYYLHPLAGIPGPFLAPLSDLYLAWTISSVPTFGLELHRKYGPIVRLAPNLLSISDPRFLPIVYNRRADKPSFYGTWLFGKTVSMFQSLSHKDHASKKRLLAPYCSLRVIREHHESKIAERVQELCEKIKERSVYTGAKLDFSEHLRWFLSDTWSHIVYGKPMGCVAYKKDINGFLEALQGLYGIAGTAAVLPWLQPVLRHEFCRKHLLTSTKAFKGLNKLFMHFENMVENRNQDPSLKSSKLFFDGLLDAKLNGGVAMTKEDLKAEVITFTAATLDGVAAFISPFIQNMIQHPDVHKRVVAEIDNADRRGALSLPVPLYDEIAELPYFKACINETLRRDAPAQTILPRVVPEGGCYLGGHYISAGTQIGASPYIIHRDTNIFGPDPELFKPERWLQDPNHVRRMEKFGMWWGYGDRECVGKYYAQVEMQKLCLQLLRQFNFSNATPEKYVHKKWAVGMFWEHWLNFELR